MRDNEPCRLERVEPKHSLFMRCPYGFIMLMILLMVVLVVVLVVLSQTTGFCQMDVYNNGLWRAGL